VDHALALAAILAASRCPPKRIRANVIVDGDGDGDVAVDDRPA